MKQVYDYPFTGVTRKNVPDVSRLRLELEDGGLIVRTRNGNFELQVDDLSKLITILEATEATKALANNLTGYDKEVLLSLLKKVVDQAAR